MSAQLGLVLCVCPSRKQYPEQKQCDDNPPNPDRNHRGISSLVRLALAGYFIFGLCGCMVRVSVASDNGLQLGYCGLKSLAEIGEELAEYVARDFYVALRTQMSQAVTFQPAVYVTTLRCFEFHF
jgi:hypothetical protein